MRYPSPDDPARAPIWENYIVAQTVAASRGQMPEHTLAFGVEVDRTRLQLRFQLSRVTEEDEEDMADIVGDLEALVGSDVEVTSSYEVREERSISPDDGISWVFLSRV